MTDFLSLPAFASKDNFHVVVETPRHAQAKFKYEPDLGAFMLSRALTLGLTYPYDWGFVPSTKAPDGDPIDALVLHNVTTNPGMVLRCEALGNLEVLQTENRRSFRNDRLVVVPVISRAYPEAKDVRDLPHSLRHQAEEFFTAGGEGTGKSLKFLGWRGPSGALAAIRRAHKEFGRDNRTPKKKIKVALDENRLSILGVQILFGFQLQAPFQTQFEGMSESARLAALLAFGLLTVAVALLIAPSTYNRIRPNAEAVLDHGVTWLIDIALVLLALAIGTDLYLVGDLVLGGLWGPLLGLGFCLIAFMFWCGIEVVQLIMRGKPRPSSTAAGKTKMEDRIDFVLIEARVILPGVQALLGFQLIVVLADSFAKLPASSEYVHLAALAAIAISAVLLIAPAAHHRIVFAGEDDPAFLPIANAYLLAGTVFLAVGMSADCYVIVTKVLGSPNWGVATAIATATLCLGLWHVAPLIVKRRKMPDARNGVRHSTSD